MAVLYGKKGNTRYNWKDDALYLLRLIEDITVATDLESIYVEGNVDKVQVNRMRRIAGWEDQS